MATPEIRKAFGNALRSARNRAQLTAEQVAQHLTQHGHRTTGSNVGAWERGQYVPRDPKVIDLLAELLEQGNTLHDVLGIQHQGATASGQDYNSKIARISPEAQAVIDTIIEAEERKQQS